MGRQPTAKRTAAAKTKAKARKHLGTAAATPQSQAKAKARSSLLIDGLQDDDPGKKRLLRRKTSDTTAVKAMYDIFKDLSHEEKFVKEVNLLTLYGRVKADKKFWKQGLLEMGPL